MSDDKSSGSETLFAAMNRTFAMIEQIGVRIGVAVTVIGFVLYTTGAVAPFLPINDLLKHWGNRAEDFLRITGLPTGWGWLGMLGHSDMLALGGLILLSSVAIAAYFGLLILLVRRRNHTYIALVLLQLCVFALAASGILGGGH
jgi:hypothetical protein